MHDYSDCWPPSKKRRVAKFANLTTPRATFAPLVRKTITIFMKPDNVRKLLGILASLLSFRSGFVCIYMHVDVYKRSPG